MNRRPFLFGLLAVPFASLVYALPSAREPVIGPCDGCDAVFDGLPGTLDSRVRIAPADEPGEPLTVSGIVSDLQGLPQAGVVVYAYHTARSGLYPPAEGSTTGAARRHGRLRAWARTDSRGAYRFDTIRPGAYPGEDMPEHIHMHVIEPGRATYYLDNLVFRDDPRLTARHLSQLSTGRGGHGAVTPERHHGVWRVRRDIVLGRNVPGYPPGARV